MSSVYVYIYDITKGLARQLSLPLIGKHLDGVWHTGIVAYGREWFFGGGGIENCRPKGTVLNEPNTIEYLGETEINENDFLEMVEQLSEGPFAVGTYNLLSHNCNNFSNTLAQFLVGKTIPAYVVDLPNEVLQTPLGSILRSFFDTPRHLKSDTADTPVSHITKTGKIVPLSTAKSSEKNEKFVRINDAVTFKPELNNEDWERLLKCVDPTANDVQLLKEIKSYFEQKEVTWTIGYDHIKVLYNQLNVQTEAKTTVLNILQLIPLDIQISGLVKYDDVLVNQIIPSIKGQSPDSLIESYFQFLCNASSHADLNDWLMSNQDAVFSSLSEFLWYGLETECRVHELCISFFFNLLCVYDKVYAKINESSSLTLSCAIIELIQNETFAKHRILHLLNLLQVCCTESKDVLAYIESIGGLNLDKYVNMNECRTIVETINQLVSLKSE